jgi:hypothetical protein
MEVRPLCTLPLIALTMAGVVVVPAPSSAAGWNCSATTLVGQPATPPVSANAGAATCQAASAGGSVPALPAPLQANVASATTSVAGPAGDPAQQQASATSEVAGLDIGIPSNVPINVPSTSINVPLGPTVDITSALRTLVPVPTGTLAGLQESTAMASGRCSNGSAQLTGSTQVSGLMAMGQALPTNQTVQQAVTVVSATTIDPSLVSQSALPPPLDSLSPLLLQPLLNALPNIAVPATVGQVGLTPGSQSVQGGTLTQEGPHLAVSVAGVTIADLALGQASVSRGDVDCRLSGGVGNPGDPGGDGGAIAGEAAPTGAVPQAQLACTARKLALIDVLDRGSYARLYGAADLRYAGRRVAIVSLWNRKVVARPIVLADGTFQAKGALPPRALRQSNRARYQARVGDERSLDLKLFRRMVVEEMSSSDGDVTIRGRVLGPLGKPTHVITIKRRVSCTKDVAVRTFKPSASGRFAVTIPAPPTGQAAVYRLQTSVPRDARSRTLFPTFTLPRAVELRR